MAARRVVEWIFFAIFPCAYDFSAVFFNVRKYEILVFTKLPVVHGTTTRSRPTPNTLIDSEGGINLPSREIGFEGGSDAAIEEVWSYRALNISTGMRKLELNSMRAP